MPKRVASILIVEDNTIIGLMLRAMVISLGYRVLGPYESLDDGCHHARADRIDYALLDYHLGDGIVALPIAEILAERHIPFAFTTGSGTAEIWQHIAGATVIGKPVMEYELEAVLP